MQPSSHTVSGYKAPRQPNFTGPGQHFRQDGYSTSSPFMEHLTSSPTYNASQRHVAHLDPGPSTERAPSVRQRPLHNQPPLYDNVAAELEARKKEDSRWQTTPHSHQSIPGPIRNTATYGRSDLPAVQGINLVSTRFLSDRFRTVFSFPVFNAVQSKCFDTIYKTNDNFVLSAPTGSGKTAIMELAICRLANISTSGSFKIVYQAPTKSLCSERLRDWQKKFAALDLRCAELTGDTEAVQLRNVQHASIIIATPEKWDSVTRKWKDHQKLMQMVKLFLIDEVHMLKEDRGATLEAVVSRMKSLDSEVRFVALSATVPNFQDIALWLGRSSMNTCLPAVAEKFGEEFRPVRLEKHVCGYQSTTNDFAFDKTLSGRLPDVIKRWSQRKPIMVFCFTRGACVETAKLLAEWWQTANHQEQYWNTPRKNISVADRELRGQCWTPFVKCRTTLTCGRYHPFWCCLSSCRVNRRR